MTAYADGRHSTVCTPARRQGVRIQAWFCAHPIQDIGQDAVAGCCKPNHCGADKSGEERPPLAVHQEQDRPQDDIDANRDVVDMEWAKQGGGMFGGEEPPAYKFNAGEKLIFWIVVIGGGFVATTGYILLFPFYGTGIANMQIAQIVHSTISVLYIAAMLVHIYMGTLGTEGAFEGMATGEVDINWAKSHHSLWYEEMSGKAKVRRQVPNVPKSNRTA